MLKVGRKPKRPIERSLPSEEEANLPSYRSRSPCGGIVSEDSVLKDVQDCHMRKAEGKAASDTEIPVKAQSWETEEPLDLLTNGREQREIRLGPERERDAVRLKSIYYSSLIVKTLCTESCKINLFGIQGFSTVSPKVPRWGLQMSWEYFCICRGRGGCSSGQKSDLQNREGPIRWSKI